MTLKEWASLSLEQQRELVVEWTKSGDWRTQMIQHDLGEEAAKALRKFLCENPHVTDVQPGGGESYSENPLYPAVELVLDVHTKDSDTPILELPARFEGFRVRQVNYGPKWDAYLRTWKRLFKELKGWDEAQTLACAQRYIDALEGGFLALPVYSRGPITKAVEELMEKRPDAVCDDRYWKVFNEIRVMIWETARRALPEGSGESVHHPDMIEGYDWDFVRLRFNELIKQYKGSEGAERLARDSDSASIPGDEVPPKV